MTNQEHWEKMYKGKQFTEVSWYQPEPTESLDFLKTLSVPADAAIIDVGGGDSYFVDYLLQLGYTNITVLDISATAIEKAKQRLGTAAQKIKWVVSDINQFTSGEKFTFWHDRAAFHFLTTEEEVQNYLQIANNHIAENGRMLIGTFSTEGPEKCSGLPVKQYNESSLTSLLTKWFEKIKCITTDHITPFNTIQQFLFCSFQKISTQHGHS